MLKMHEYKTNHYKINGLLYSSLLHRSCCDQAMSRCQEVYYEGNQLLAAKCSEWLCFMSLWWNLHYYAARTSGSRFNHFLPPQFIGTVSKGIAICSREESLNVGSAAFPERGRTAHPWSALQLSCVFCACAGLGARVCAWCMRHTQGFAPCLKVATALEGEGWRRQGRVWVRNRLG